MRSVECVAAPPETPAAREALSSLIHALREEESVLVARYVWRQNAAPTLVALRPHVSRKGAKECLYLQTLPFAEDLRDWPFDPLPTPSAAQSSAVDALIDAMDLMDAAPGAGGEALRPKRMPNPSIQRFHSCTLARARDPRAPVPGLPEEDARELRAPPSVRARLRRHNVPQRLMSAFRLERVAPAAGTEGRKRTWWFGAVEERRTALPPPVDVKRLKTEAEEASTREKDRAGAGARAEAPAEERDAPAAVKEEPGISAAQERIVGTISPSLRPLRDLRPLQLAVRQGFSA